jgi:transposase
MLFFVEIIYNYRMRNDIDFANEISPDSSIFAGEIEHLVCENKTLSNENSRLKISLEEAQQKIEWFEEQIKLWRQRKFGKQSEKLDQQLEIIFDADETISDDSSKETNPPAATETIAYTRQKKSKGRKINTSKLFRVREVHDLPEEQKNCHCCGGQLHKVRDEVTETLETIPEQKYVVEHIQPQYACRQCETMISAKKETNPILKCMAGASLLTEVIVNKYQYHLPLYRQSQIFKSTGIDIPDNTLGNWVMQAGEALCDLDQALYAEILLSSYLQVDETPVKVLKPEKKGYMWSYLSPLTDHRLIRFRFDLTRRGEVVERDLDSFEGLLQTDGYSGYNTVRKAELIIAFGCLSHCRRKFVEVIKIGSTKSVGKAEEALNYFGQLYEIEDKARKEKLSYEERKALREKEAIPIIEKFDVWIHEAETQVPPGSHIGKAISYTLKQWPYVMKYVHYGEVEIDTNWVENQIRPFALGRRNWLFIGNERSAQIGALFYSLIQSAKLNNLNPKIYLHYVLTQVHALRKKEIEARDLLPHRIDIDKLKQFVDKEFEKNQRLFSNIVVNDN